MLPLKFVKWQLVYYYYKKWSGLEQFDLLLAKLREKVRSGLGQNRQASLGIMDSQSVRWGNNRALSGYDENKKVKGIKRHVVKGIKRHVVKDKNGFLLAVMVTVAHVHDSKAALLLMRVLKSFLGGIKVIIADCNYRGEIAAHAKKLFGYILQVVMRSDDKKTGFKPTHKDG